MTTARDFDAELARVEALLGHRFRDRSLLAEALSHASFANERANLAPRDNERLEFLGDALVGAVVAARLHARHPDAREGELTRRRAELVRTEALADFARELDLGSALRLGKGELRQGGRTKQRLLASAFEACIGAVLVDGGADVAFRVVGRLFDGRVEDASEDQRDPKSRLQELTQAHRRLTPTYAVLSEEGPDHDRAFEVGVSLEGSLVATGRGRSKLAAEQAAADAAVPAVLRMFALEPPAPEPEAP